MKSYMAFLGSMMFFVVCVSLYLMMESVQITNQGRVDFRENDLDSIEVKIKQIEVDLKRNHKTINMIKDTVREFANGDSSSLSKLQKALDDAEKQHAESIAGVVDMKQSIKVNTSRVGSVALSGDVCYFTQHPPDKTDIQMLDVYDTLKFDNPDGGAWKQGWAVTYNNNQFAKQKLRVFVVPHSHNDPGWLKTYERYYSDQTRHILDNMLERLEALPKMRFIYAEMSFFSLWWNEINQDKKNRVKKLLAEKRLEIVAGGWVMNDEANAHYFAMIDQMIEGNQWLHNQMGVKPISGWAIDPFGHSPTMSYILKKAGFKNMLIQRVHYSVKKYLAKNRQLEFVWRQNWDHTGSTDIYCHLMPFYSYDVPHTCGPDPKICCQFDFARLPGGRIACPWKIPPQEINDNNVHQRAEMLVDQYKKKSTLYNNNNVLFVPLGDDFRYDKTTEWDAQYRNYQRLFDYMNAQQGWNIEASFGTLSDYFDEVHSRGKSVDGIPQGAAVLSGDFYTYADRDDHYWSGYYTSRPFYKRMDRVLEAHLRGAEILYSLAVAHSHHHGVKGFPETRLMKYLVAARRNLGLFQHHDGITGTSKDHVVADYGTKMLNSLVDLKQVTAEAAHFLALSDKSTYSFSESDKFFDVDETIQAQDAIPERTIIKIDSTATPVVFYNSLAHSRTLVVTLHVSQPDVKVTDPKGNVVTSQVNPYWVTDDEISTRLYKLMFVATIPALGLSRYTIQGVAPNTNPSHLHCQVTLYNSRSESNSNAGNFKVIKFAQSQDFEIENAEMKALFSGTSGLLKKTVLKTSGETIDSEVQFLKYGVTNSKDKSGAYLFMPDGPAQPVHYKTPFIRVMEGPVMSEVNMFIATGSTIQHTARLYNSPGVDSLSIDILNVVDLHGDTNKELIMRVSSSIKNNHQFHTDLNGFQIQSRKTHEKLPMQANFYPMPTMAYIHDSKVRMSILSGQSLGVASLFEGQIEIVQDRRLNQDDNRGLQQGVLDNKRTPNKFRILFEQATDSTKSVPDQATGYPSLTAQLASLSLIHPVVTLPPGPGASRAPSSHMMHTFTPLAEELPCQMHVFNLRSMQHSEENSDLRFVPREQVALLFHRLAGDCSYPVKAVSCDSDKGSVTLERMFQGLTVSEVKSSTLTLTPEGDTDLDASKPITVSPMEVEAFKIKFH